MANLAIKGDSKRGKEVIELLEILGSKNSKYCIGTNPDRIYFIDDDNDIDFCYVNISANYKIFTLEKFYKEFPYKVGDKVITIYGIIGIIEKLVWSNRDNEVRYELEDDENSLYFANELRLYEEEFMEEQDNNVSFNTEDRGNARCLL